MLQDLIVYGQKRKEPGAASVPQSGAIDAADGSQKGPKRMRLDAEGSQAMADTPAESEDEDLEVSKSLHL